MEEEEDIEVKKCNNCKCWREIGEFIGSNGIEVKRCLKCREKDTIQKQKPEVREKRNAIQKEKKYYQAYRDKKRTEDEEGFLKHNAPSEFNASDSAASSWSFAIVCIAPSD